MTPPADPFVHLHVASGFSLRHGATHPQGLVQRAAEHGMDTLALTDRDGLYGAVRFTLAARSAGLRPILGVDLAVEPGTGSGADRGRSGDATTGAARPESGSPPARRSPARGGVSVDPGHPRVTVLASGRAGWAALCRLVSATHLRGERGSPVSSLALVAEHAAAAAEAGGELLVLLGPASELGRAVTRRRPDLARAVLGAWRAALPDPTTLLVEVVSHRAPGDGPGSAVHAARSLAVAREAGATAVLTNLVRYADTADAPTADVLDAARRLVPLDPRHLDRRNAQGYLKSGKEMAEVAEEVARLAGLAADSGRGLLAATRRVADRCALDPAADLGLGLGAAGAHFPETELVLDPQRLAAARTAAADRGEVASIALRHGCEAGIGARGLTDTAVLRDRLEHELRIIDTLGFAGYFLTVADVVALIRQMGVRVAARGSGAGSLVTYLLGISGVDPLRHGLVMERFLSPRRSALPDIDIDVESARRTEIYRRVIDRYGGQRVSAVSMMDTYRVRHAVRDVGAALGLPPGEIDAVAKAFPHIRARDARAALAELPELRASGIADSGAFDTLLRLVERLDGLPRHVALHPCGVLLSDASLLDRTPVEASWMGFPLSQFDKDDVEELGLLKLDILGVRMQSAMAHALDEIARVDGPGPADVARAGGHDPRAGFLTPDGRVDLDAVPLDDPGTFGLVQSTRTLGCFQIESPGQRELIGKFAPETFDDLIIDISLFRPGPVKSDMVTPFLQARQGWAAPEYLHPDLRQHLEQTCGVVVFHEQVLHIVATLTGADLAEADEVRRALGDPVAKEDVRVWFPARALARGYDAATVDRAWAVLEAFASFGFCKAHAAAFALPTYQSAWLKAHHPAAFLAGVLTHDPGMYPKRLILDDARNFGIAVLGLDVNRSDGCYRVERLAVDDEPPPQILEATGRQRPDWLPAELPDARGYGIRLSLAEVKGISEAEVTRIVAGRPYATLTDFWHRARVSRPVVERLVLAGAFDSLYGIGGLRARLGLRRTGRITRRDLLLQVGELDRWDRAVARGAGKVRGVRGRRPSGAEPDAGVGSGSCPGAGSDARSAAGGAGSDDWARSVAARAAAQAQAPAAAQAEPAMQLALDFGAADVSPGSFAPSGLPEMTGSEQVRAELEVLGLDASRHVLDFYTDLLGALRVVRARDLLTQRSRAELLVAGVKVATQTPPVRSGHRVVFVTLDDTTGPVDATFFSDAQGRYAATLFHSWLLLVRGELRRTGPRGVSLRGTGAWDLTALHAAWQAGGLDPVLDLLEEAAGEDYTEQAVASAAGSRSTRPVVERPPGVGTDGRRRVLVHPSGFRQSPYADVRPSGEDVRDSRGAAARADGAAKPRAEAPRKLWHASPGSAGR